MITLFIITAIFSMLALTGLIVVEILHDIWGRGFSEELDKWVARDHWIKGDMTQALSIELIQRSDGVTR